MVRRHISWAVLLLALACYADAVTLPVTWLNDNVLDLQAGDEAVLFAVPEQQSINLDNLNWEGGVLRLEGLSLDAGSSRGGGLPLVVSQGQSLELVQTTIAGADSAIVLRGGSAQLSETTLATTLSGIVVDDAQSSLVLQQSHFCIADRALDLRASADVLVEGSLFLTNSVAIVNASAGTLTIEDCLFQGNEIGIHLEPGAQPPVFGADVDLVDCRWQQILNESGQTVELGDLHLSAPEWLEGPWTRSGVDPGEAVHPLKVAAAPAIIISDDIVEILPLEVFAPGETTDGLPVRICSLAVYINCGTGWYTTDLMSVEQFIVIDRCDGVSGFYKVKSVIGEWPTQ